MLQTLFKYILDMTAFGTTYSNALFLMGSLSYIMTAIAR